MELVVKAAVDIATIMRVDKALLSTQLLKPLLITFWTDTLICPDSYEISFYVSKILGLVPKSLRAINTLVSEI